MSTLLLAYAIDNVLPVVKIFTLCFLICAVLLNIIMYITKKKFFKTLFKRTLIVCFFYATTVGLILLILETAKHFSAEYLESNFVNPKIVGYVLVPSIIAVGLFVLGFSLRLLVGKNEKTVKTITALFGTLSVLSVITTLVLIAVYYSNYILGDGYYTDENYGNLKSGALYISAFALVFLSVIITILSDKDKKTFDTRAIATAGITVAMSFTLSYVKLFKMPQGGSVTLASMFPVMLFSYMYGTKKGIIVGFIYGMLQGIQDPYIVHPAQFLLDYPIAFSALGLAGVFNKKKNKPQLRFSLGAIISGVFRFSSHLLSGVFAFGAYAVDTGISNFWAYSLAYNSYVFIDVLIVIFVGVLLLSSKSVQKEILKTDYKGEV